MPDEKLVGEKAHLRCKVIIEVLGKPKEHVEKTISEYVEKIKKDSGFIVLAADFAGAVEKDSMWTSFVELDMVIKGLPKLIAFCFDYMPSSVEILKPEEFMLQKSTIEHLVNDLQARLHHVDMIVKKQKNENDFLRHNLQKSVSNVILVALSKGSMSMDILSKITGIHGKELEVFLNSLIEENKIKKEDNLYNLVI